MNRGVAILRRVLLFPIAAAAYGWQDHLRTLPGPRVAFALPLQEPGHHASASILGVIAVWLAAFAIAAAIAPPRRLPRPAGALLRGIVTFALMIAVQAMSLELVRQATLGFAWHAALTSATPYIAGTCAVISTLAFTRRTATESRYAMAARRLSLPSLRALLPSRARPHF
jgi:hypothetical protein